MSKLKIDYTTCSNVKKGKAVGELVYKNTKKVNTITI